ncbi:alpha/beta hydrolase [Escherichia coli]|nr:alpha/beta hydrolase [Escherichia coli]
MQYINGIRYTDSGPYNGGPGFPPVVLISDMFMSTGMFKKQELFLSRKYRVVCIDINVGDMGLLSKDNNHLCIQDVTNKIIEIMEVLAIDKFVACGFRKGGVVCLNIGIEYSERLCGMIIMGVGSANFIHYNKHIYSWPDDEHDKKACLPLSGDPLSLITLPEYITGRLDRIHQPVLVIHGDADNEVSVYSVIKLSEMLKYSRMIFIPGGSGCLMLTHCQTVNNVIQFWLSDYFL